VALKTQIDTLQEQVATLENEVKTTQGRLVHERAGVETATQHLNDERTKVENLGKRIAQLERQLSDQTAAAEGERDQFRLEVEAARRIEADLRGELSSLDRRHDAATEALRADKSLIES